MRADKPSKPIRAAIAFVVPPKGKEGSPTGKRDVGKTDGPMAAKDKNKNIAPIPASKQPKGSGGANSHRAVSKKDFMKAKGC